MSARTERCQGGEQSNWIAHGLYAVGVSQARPLWQEIIDALARGGLTREIWPGGRDRARVREALWELYLLGERPTLAELRGHVESHLPQSTWRTELVSLWADRLHFPARVPASRSSRYPFALMDQPASEGRTILDRLSEAAVRAVNDFTAAVDRNDDELVLRDLSQILDIQVDALRVWGRISRVREQLDHGPGIRPRSRSLPPPLEAWRFRR